MTSIQLGLLTGFGLAVAFGAFAAVAVLGGLGLLAGRVFDGKLDLSQLSDRDCG